MRRHLQKNARRIPDANEHLAIRALRQSRRSGIYHAYSIVELLVAINNGFDLDAFMIDLDIFILANWPVDFAVRVDLVCRNPFGHQVIFDGICTFQSQLFIG